MEEEKQQDRHLAGYFDHIHIWYEKVKDFTFETRFIPISLSEARAIKKYREASRSLSALASFANVDVSEMEPLDQLTNEQKTFLLEVKEKLQQVISTMPEGCFVRMSTRSPKDAVLNSKKVLKILEEEITLHPFEDVFSQECYVSDTITYWRSISKAQKVTDAEEAMELIQRSNRIFEDISLAELFLQNKSDNVEAKEEEGWDLQLVVRRWEEIDPELEFRAFVLKGKMIGITQYHKTCYVPFLSNNQNALKTAMLEMFQRVSASLEWIPQQTYTIDFALSQSVDDFNLRVVEINSYPPVAGTSLFDWDNHDDRQLLQEGGDLSFRVLESPVPWSELSDIHEPLKQFIDIQRGRAKPITHNPNYNNNSNNNDNGDNSENENSGESSKLCSIQ